MRAVKSAFKEAESTLYSKLEKGTTKAGVPSAWLKKYLADWADENREAAVEGMVPLKDALKNFNTTLVKDVVADYESQREVESIKNVKSEGVKIAGNSSKKVALLKKLDLSGAEFHALCLMIKEQIS